MIAAVPVECTNCSGGTLSIILAAAALLTAATTLYLTALRRATVEVDVIESRLSVAGKEPNGMARVGQVTIYMLVANLGAAATFVENIWLTDLKCEMDEGATEMWTGIGNRSVEGSLVEGSRFPVGTFPQPLERDGAKTARLVSDLVQAPIGSVEEYGDRLLKVGEVSVTLRWSFRRRRLFSLQKLATKERKRQLRFGPAHAREAAAAYLENEPGREDLVKRLRGAD